LQTATIFYLVFALLLSISVAFFQYYYKVTNKPKVTSLLFVLKTLSLFLLILLLINPTIENTVLENEKPVLSILVDNSKSIAFFKEGNSVSEIVTNLSNSADLNTKFSLSDFSFGKNLQVLDSLSFLENETNITNAIVEVNELNKDKIAPIILITDGNQTIGAAYEFLNTKQPIYPVIIGDTTKYVDVKITQLNVNKYSYLQNKFPVEVLLNYDGNEAVTSQFSIFNNGKTVFRENISFSSDKKSATITANLTSTKEGLQYYTASISTLKNEKNIKNNSKSFSVEVINEQTKVLILSSVLHPDIGTLKKSIESNQQRSVDVFMVDNFKGQIEDYKLIILNQVNAKFNTVLSLINQQNSNYLMISGVNTDWNFINKQQLGFTKNAINQLENYGATYNEGFLTFLQEDIGFNNFPPLKEKFGEISISKEHQTLVYQNINGVQTKQPLLSIFEVNNQKSAVLFGEGIWKWRAASFLNSNSFEEFDSFTSGLVQYLASNKKRNRLEVRAENLYPANSTIHISAFYTDKNYQFDARASLEITITNSETKEVTKIPFSLIHNSYQVEIENLPSGAYSYTVNVLGQDIKNDGRFVITDYQIEEQFTNANVNKLEQLAAKSGGKVFYKNQVDDLTKELLDNESFYTVQKSSVKQQNLIDWKRILFFIISLLTAEWFIRKYNGKI
tara:strand:+ start:228 stop:2255 length:2028 start_codon:yes stop_codon:yes gene_type:complete